MATCDEALQKVRRAKRPSPRRLKFVLSAYSGSNALRLTSSVNRLVDGGQRKHGI